MQFQTLEGKRVAIWGLGREGRAALQALRKHLPNQALTLFCKPGEASDLDDPHVCIFTHQPDATALGAFDYVIKSPGISAYLPEILDAQAEGTVFTSGTALWFGENKHARVIGITGTKGKSTTSALLAHVLRQHGIETALAGNIGLPLLALDGDKAAIWVVELSSFQTGEAGSLEAGVVTSLYQEHLDWHGSVERYISDKLKLQYVSKCLFVNGLQDILIKKTQDHANRHLFGLADSWHIQAYQGRDCIFYQDNPALFLHELPMAGKHNALNVCAVLSVLDTLSLDRDISLTAIKSFSPLPHRQQNLGQRHGFTWINDSISTTPEAALAALDALGDKPVTLILGGYDRGLAWQAFIQKIKPNQHLKIITQGDTGKRIAEAMYKAGETAMLNEVENLDQAIDLAKQISSKNTYIVLSPGAPSFDQFGSYVERGRYFAKRAGFADNAIMHVDGLGIS